MLHLYQSNRLENLAAMMLDVHQNQPLPSPLAREQIIVQSQGMRRYITQYLAKKQGIAANLQFSLPAGLAWQLTRRLLPETPELNPFSSEVMHWRLLDLFQSSAFSNSAELAHAHAVLQSYLHNGDYACYQLAGEIADIFDQYLVYRPEWTEAWSQHRQPESLQNSETAHWQAQLWRALDDGRYKTPHRAALWQNLMDALNTPQPAIASRYCVFGIATLAPMYLRLLTQMAQHHDIHIFALNPSDGFWGNVIEPKTILAGGDEDLSQQGHPLLASLGKQGRDFFNQLPEEMIHSQQESFPSAPPSGSLLHHLQYHIQTQILPETAAQEDDFPSQHFDYIKQVIRTKTEKQQHFQAALIQAQHDYEQACRQARHEKDLRRAETARHQAVRLAQMTADNSIQIHSAHSPLRELQILKDRLLALLDEHPDLQPSNIAVLTPNIEPYAPYIEAVFGQHCPDSYPLPYSIADIKLSRAQPYLQALTQILDVCQSRFEANKILNLLQYENILAQFELTREDVPLINDTITQLNIHWGADAAQRQEHGDDNALFTWQQGLNRLIAGWMLPENQTTLWQGISPFSMRPDFMPVMARFAALIQTLSTTRQMWQTPVSVSDWITRIRQIMHDTLLPQADDQAALQQLETALANWQNETELAQFHEPISAAIALAHVRRFLDSQSQAGFLRGGITFCSMVPMRSLPFKVLCLLGLNDGDFPRSTPISPFDLIARHSKAGDRARRDDDRYLFLEAILSARQTLYLSYLGKDIRNDEPRAPSVLINELIDTLAAQMGLPAAALLKHWVIVHPLQAFSRQYFSGSPTLTGSRQDYAHALNQPTQTRPPFINAQPQNPIPDTQPDITQDDLIQFWRNPVRAYLRTQLHWQAPYADAEQEAGEPFTIVRQRSVADAYQHARQTRQNFTQTAQQLRAQSQLPTGLLGQFHEQHYARLAAQLNPQLLNASALANRHGILNLPSGKLHYALNHLTCEGQILHANHFLPHHNQHSRLTAADKIQLLLLHLIYCAIPLSGSLKTDPTQHQPTAPKTTHFISLTQTISLPEIPQNQAQETLDAWLAAYLVGQTGPLPFFPRVNLAAALALAPTPSKIQPTWEQAIDAARKKYHTGHQSIGQEDYPEIKVIYNRTPDAPPPYQSSHFRHLTENLLLPLLNCLIALDHKAA